MIALGNLQGSGAAREMAGAIFYRGDGERDEDLVGWGTGVLLAEGPTPGLSWVGTGAGEGDLGNDPELNNETGDSDKTKLKNELGLEMQNLVVISRSTSSSPLDFLTP